MKINEVKRIETPIGTLEIEYVPPYIRGAEKVEHLFGIGRYKLWRLRASKQITASKDGKFCLYKTQSILAYLKKHENRRPL